MENTKKILKHFFAGIYSKKEYKQVQAIFQHSEEYGLNNILSDHWDGYSSEDLPEIDLSDTSKKIHRQIRIEERMQTRNRFLHVFQRIAAILILPLITSMAIYFVLNKEEGDDNMAYAKIHCPMSVRTQFQLPDGSTGFLNSGSTLKFPVKFAKSRDVELTGEAYFDVVHDADHPFTVNTKNLQISVLGTQFNVLAFDADFNEEVVLQKGKVKVSTRSGQLLDMLNPNEKLTINKKTRKFSVNKVEAFQFTTWTDGKLILRNEKFEAVAKRLGRWYNANIIIEDERLLEYAFRATFTDEPLEEVLNLLKHIAPFKYVEQERVTTKDNEYLKRSVLIKLDEKRVGSFH